MGWRDGCAPQPTVGEGAEPVRFAFATADAVGQRLDGLRRAIDVNVTARSGAAGHLVDWAGGHRLQYDDHRAAQEAVLTGAEIDVEIARLRTAWDAAAGAQLDANRAAADAVDAPPGSDPPR